MRRALKIDEQSFGENHPNVAIRLNNLAGLLCCKGDYEGAESLYRRALAMREKTLGTNHPDVIKSKNNLANLEKRKKEASLPIKDSIDINTLNIQSEQPLYLDENVQFTVYRPKKIQPVKWYPLLTFAHLSERPPDAKEDEPDPIAEVQKQAKQILGEQVDNYADLTQDSRQAVPRQGEITLVPQVPGIEFNPPSRSFLWTEAVHKEEFRIRASQQLDGKMAEGRISVFLSGSIVLAEIGLRIRVDSREQHKTSSTPYEHISSRAYRRIFASYSRKDLEIVEEFEKYAIAVGDEYLRDLVHIRTGEMWDERLIQMISQADIFQLFWSWNSIRSKFVEREWKYALSLKRAQFVRPVYWEDPMPELKDENLPPEELQKLHFQRLPIKTTSVQYLQEQGNQERPKISAKQGKRTTKTIPDTSKTTSPSRKKTLRYTMFICLPIVFISGLVIGTYQYMDFSERKANTTLEEINGIASKNEPQQLLQNRLENLLCQKGIVPEEIESAKQIEEEEPGGNIDIANKEDIISGGEKLSENTIAEIIRKDFGLPIHTNLIDSDKIQEQVPINETISQDIPNEEPEVKGGQHTFVACMRDGAELRDKPESNAQVIKTIPWMTDFVVIKRYTDLQKREWICVGDIKTPKEAIPQGWILKDDLLMRMEAMKEEGIYKKAIVVTYYNKATKELGGAPLRYAPFVGVPQVGHELTLYNFFHIYDMREDDEGKETFCLIGNEAAVRDYTKPENIILGWVPMSKLFMWNTRVAAEYDKSTLDKRGPVRIYESLEDLKAVIEGRKSPEQVRVLATEDINKKEMFPEDFRFPIIDEEIEINGLKVWKIGFAGAVTSPVNVATIPQPELDILFVCDGTGNMKYFKDAVISTIQNVQNKAIDYWKTNWNWEKPPSIRFSIAMYKDNTAKDPYKRLPFEKDNQDKITQFVNSNEFTGGKGQPAVFHGLSQAIKDAVPEFSKNSFRMVFLIGDIGNMGVSDNEDPKGYKVDDVAKLLRDNNCDFYAIQVASGIEPPHGLSVNPREKFETQTKAIINQLTEGSAKYVSANDSQQIKAELEKTIFELLDQRFRVIQNMVQVCVGKTSLNDLARSGTLLSKRVLDLLEQDGTDINKVMNEEKKQTMSVFGEGFVAATEPGTGIRMMKPVAHVNREDVEALIGLLGGVQMAGNDSDYAKKVLRETLELVTNDPINDQTMPADIIKKQMGIPVKSALLQVPLTDLYKYPDKLQEAIREFKKKLFLLRGVANEREVTVKEDEHGNVTYELGKDKRWFTGTRGNEWMWLDLEYLP